MNAEEIGMAGVTLGAGRKTKADSIDHAAGLILHKKTGDAVNAGDVLCTLFTEREETLDMAQQRFLDAITVGDTAPTKKPLIVDVIKGV